MRSIARSGLAGFWAKAPALGCARLVLGEPLEKVEAGDGEWFCGAVYEVTVVMGSRVRLRERVWRVFGTKALNWAACAWFWARRWKRWRQMTGGGAVVPCTRLRWSWGRTFNCASGFGEFWDKSPKLGCVRLVLGVPSEKVKGDDEGWCCSAVYEVIVLMGSHVRLCERVCGFLELKPPNWAAQAWFWAHHWKR